MTEKAEIQCTEPGCGALANWEYDGGAFCSGHQSTVLNRMYALGKVELISEPSAVAMFRPIWRPDPTDPGAPANWRAQIGNAREAQVLAEETATEWEATAKRLAHVADERGIEIESLRALLRSVEERLSVVSDEKAQLETDLRGYRDAKQREIDARNGGPETGR